MSSFAIKNKIDFSINICKDSTVFFSEILNNMLFKRDNTLMTEIEITKESREKTITNFYLCRIDVEFCKTTFSGIIIQLFLVISSHTYIIARIWCVFGIKFTFTFFQINHLPIHGTHTTGILFTFMISQLVEDRLLIKNTSRHWLYSYDCRNNQLTKIVQCHESFCFLWSSQFTVLQL